MKRSLTLILFSAFFILGSASLTSCNKKTGCPINENVHVKTNKKGEFSNKRGKSNLLPKHMRKRGK